MAQANIVKRISDIQLQFIKEVNREIEASSAKAIAQYAVFSPYEFASVAIAPNFKNIVKVSMELEARGIEYSNYEFIERAKKKV